MTELHAARTLLEGDGAQSVAAINRTHDPWLDPLRNSPAFTKLLRQAEARHRDAVAAFTGLRGERVLGVPTFHA